jgi:hypothetical protein
MSQHFACFRERGLLNDVLTLSQSITTVSADGMDGYASVENTKQSITELLKQIETKLEELK